MRKRMRKRRRKERGQERSGMIKIRETELSMGLFTKQIMVLQWILKMRKTK
jgi:hypothetical protein